MANACFFVSLQQKCFPFTGDVMLLRSPYEFFKGLVSVFELGVQTR